MQQHIQPVKHPIHTKLTLSGSQSVTLRALFLAALGDGVSEISGICINSTVRTLITGLHQIGIVAQLDESTKTCIIAGNKGKTPKKQATLWCDNSKIVTQLLLILCATTPGTYVFDGEEALRSQSLLSTLNILSRQGANRVGNKHPYLPLTLLGADSLEGGDIILNTTKNSQLISILLMIAPFARTAFNFTTHHLAHQPLIDLTCSIMADFGVLVHRIHQGHFMVPVPQRYKSQDMAIEPDLVLGSYLFAAAVITQGEVTLTSINSVDCKQPQIKLLTLLKKMGAEILENNNHITVKGTAHLQGIETTLDLFSDIFLIVAMLAPFAKTPTRLTHAGSLHSKEKERLLLVKNALTDCGITTENNDNSITIFPGTPKGTLIRTNNNPKIAMAFAVLGLKVPGILLDNVTALISRYPDFFALWENLADHKEKQRMNE